MLKHSLILSAMVVSMTGSAFAKMCPTSESIMSDVVHRGLTVGETFQSADAEWELKTLTPGEGAITEIKLTTEGGPNICQYDLVNSDRKIVIQFIKFSEKTTSEK